MNQPRARITHELKTWPEYFQATFNGLKKFELRRNDRTPPFQVADQLRLREWDPAKYINPGIEDEDLIAAAVEAAYTGRELLVRVDYIMDDAFRFGVDPDYVIMSVSLVS